MFTEFEQTWWYFWLNGLLLITERWVEFKVETDKLLNHFVDKFILASQSDHYSFRIVEDMIFEVIWQINLLIWIRAVL